MATFVDKIENNPVGKTIIGVIMGLGLATLFRKTCKDGSCVIVRGPHANEVKQNVYKTDGDACYMYTQRPAKCPS
jgi:hypothetical protein